MLTKKILLTDGVVKEMNFEEVFYTFEGLIHKTARKTNVYGYDYEDVVQEATIGLLNAFDTYDEKNAFIVHAKWQIKKQMTVILSYANAKKRESQKDSNNSSLDEQAFDDSEKSLHNTLADATNIENEFVESEFLSHIVANLNESEKKTLLVILGDVQNSELAEEEGISRQAITNRIAKLKNKLASLINSYNVA